MAHWKRVLPGRILTVNLADRVLDFDATLARVLAHVGLPPTRPARGFTNRTPCSHRRPHPGKAAGERRGVGAVAGV